MKNKVILFVLILFLIIGINNYCNATDYTNLIVDTDVVDFGLGQVDFSPLLLRNGLSVEIINSYNSSLMFVEDNILYVYFTDAKFYYDSSTNWVRSTNGTFGIALKQNGSVYGVLGSGGAGAQVVYVDSNKKITCNALYSDNSLNSFFDYTGVNSNNIMFFSAAFNKVVGLQSFLNDLLSSLNIDSLFNVVLVVIPIIVVAVLFVLGYSLFRKLLHRFK